MPDINPYFNQPNYMYSNINPYQQNRGIGIQSKIIRVNGENGARNINLAPNSEILMLDTTNPIVWLAQTDGAGYLSVTPFDISVHQDAPPFDPTSLEQRVAKIEKIIGDLTGEQSNPQ